MQINGLNRLRGFEPVKDAPEDTILPTRATDGSAGYDFYAPSDIIIYRGGRTPNTFLNVKAYMQKDEYLQLKIRNQKAKRTIRRFI